MVDVLVIIVLLKQVSSVSGFSEDNALLMQTTNYVILGLSQVLMLMW